MQNMPIGIFRGDDTDAFSYQTIVGTIKTDLDLTGCKAVFRYLGFSMEFDPIPENRKLTIVIPADETKKFPPGLGYASLRVYDSEDRLKTFSNRIMVFVATKTPMFGSDEFEVDFNVRASLEPLKFFVGPNPDDFDEYRGYVEKVIDRASASKYGLAILLDAIDSDLGANDGVAATPVAVKAAYAAIIQKLTDDYYTAEQTDEAIDRVAAYYITYDAAGNPFPTYAALANAQTVYSGGKVRVPTRNDYCVVLVDETHQGAEYRYIYAVAEGQTTGSWQAQFPVEGVMTIDQNVTKNSTNPVASGGVWSAIWGALAVLPAGFTSLYDWCVSQLAGKLSLSGGTMDRLAKITWSNSFPGSATYSISRDGISSRSELPSSNWTKPWADIAEISKTVPTSRTVNDKPLSSDVTLTGADIPLNPSSGAPNLNSVVNTLSTQIGEKQNALTAQQLANIAAVPNKLDKSGGTMTGDLTFEDGHGAGVCFNRSGGYKTEIFYDGASDALEVLTADDNNSVVSDIVIPTTEYGVLALTADLRYALTTKTISNGAVTLDDRAINAVAVSSSLASLTVNFPTATSGKARDFGLRLTVASGITTAPQIVLPQGVTCENADGEAPEIGADGAATILYFTETASGVFLVKGEVLQTITA